MPSCCKPARAKMKVAAVKKALKKVEQPHQGEKKAKAKKAPGKKAPTPPRAKPCSLCGKAAKQVAALKAKKR